MPLMNPLSARISNFQRDRAGLGRRHTGWCRRASRPRLELLEDRTLLSVDVVENSNDNGPGSLRETIGNAAAGDTIEFNMSAGHVTSPITLTSGELGITVNLTIEGPGAGTVAISGNSNSRVFQVSSVVTATISGLTIKDGEVASLGGGIRNGGSLKLADDVFTSNSASNSGGALYNSAGSLSIAGCDVTDNKAANYDGGGIYVAAGMVTIQGSTLVGNKCANEGGAILNYSGALTLTNSAIDNNNVGANGLGGGIVNSGRLTLTNSTVSTNTAEIGGGILNVGTLTVTNSTISNNSAPGADGGGIDNGTGARLIFTDSTLSGNTAEIGAGILN